jgi:hypothetical protein
MATKKKKKKKNAEAMHRQLQDAVQALPYMIEQHRKGGRWFKAFMLRWFSGPLVRVTAKLMGARRYRGEEGRKLKQADKMKRHLEQRKAAMKHVQEHMPRRRTRG